VHEFFVYRQFPCVCASIERVRSFGSGSEATMPEVRSAIRRAVQGLEPRAGGLQRTLEKARRRGRRRRLAVALVALSIFAFPAAWFAAVTLRGDADPDSAHERGFGGRAPEPELVTYPGLNHDDALNSGHLVAEGGCTFFDYSDGTRMLLAWPEGMQAAEGDDGRLEIMNEEGAVVAREGEYLEVSGGTIAPNFLERLTKDPPEECITREIWLVGFVLEPGWRKEYRSTP